VSSSRVSTCSATPALRQGIKAFSDWPTVPQLFVKGEFVCGCDIVCEMFETGELAQLLASRGVTTAPVPTWLVAQREPGGSSPGAAIPITQGLCLADGSFSASELARSEAA
jgi:hypothetical protein